MDWDTEMTDDFAHGDNEGFHHDGFKESSQGPTSPPAKLESGPNRGAVANEEEEAKEEAAIVPNKLHIRGLDVLTTDDIKSYVKEHFGAVDKVEWIDDSSANLVFGSEATAKEALISLSSIHVADPNQLPPLECLPGKPLSTKAEICLQVRLAISSDRKLSGAAARSRFYLLHPEYDPEERRHRDGVRSRYRERDLRSYRNHRDDYDSRRRKSDDEPSQHFDASFYDDDEQSLAIRATQRSRSPVAPQVDNSSKELFPDRETTVPRRPTHRSRSTSPARTREKGRRSDVLRENRTGAERIKARLAGEMGIRELFPSRSTTLGGSQLDQLEEATRGARISGDGGTVGTASYQIKGLAASTDAGGGFSIKGSAARSAKEHLPDEFGGNSGNAGKELFSRRLEGRGKPRQRAEDLFN